jgi:16S rRNA (cytosine1402-N4)-methyltransferase
MTDETGIGPVGAAHVPVLVAEVAEWLRPRPGARLVDATVGLGGHAATLLAAAPGSTLLAVDRDPEALAAACARLADAPGRVVPRQATFDRLPALLAELGWDDGVDAVLVDLGVSSLQLDTGARGFAFRHAGPLDMRMDPGAPLSAAEVLNAWSEAELDAVLRDLGEERQHRRIARAIVRARPLATTADLARVVAGVLGEPGRGIHPATRTFQAIRLVVNDELGQLDRLLDAGWRLLRAGGRLAIIAYHSLEDRRVKLAFRAWAAACHCPPGVLQCRCGWRPTVRLLTRRPLRPSDAEIRRNPRARSARLRVVERRVESA